MRPVLPTVQSAKRCFIYRDLDDRRREHLSGDPLPRDPG